MGIFSRFADIVNSNLNALLDKAEDPAKMVRLIIQEMEDTLVEVRSNSAKALADKKELARRAKTLAAQVSDWSAKAQLALQKNREDLAKSALIERKNVQQQLDALEGELTQVDQQISRLQDEIGQLEAKLKDAKTRQQAMVVRQNTAQSRLEIKRQLDSGKIADSMARFENYERRIDDLEANVEAHDLGKKSLHDEFAELEAQDHIDAELEAMKAKMNQPKQD